MGKNSKINPKMLVRVFNRVPDAIILMDFTSGKVCATNHSAKKLLRRSLTDLMGRSFHEIFKTDQADNFKEIQKKILNKKRQSLKKETEVLRSDQKCIPVELTINLIPLNGSYVWQFHVRNIQKERKIQSAFAESEHKYRNLVERANDGIAIVADGIIQYCNRSMAKMVGGAVSKLVNKPFHQFIHESQIKKISENYGRRIIGQKVESIYETIIKKMNGDFLKVEINSDRIIYKGNPAVLAIVRDITTRKKYEDNLRTINSQLETLIQSIPDVVYFKDQQGRNLIFNKAFENFIGKSKTEITGKKDIEIMAQNFARKCVESDKIVFKNQHPIRIEEMGTDSNGMEMFFETIKSPLFDNHGNQLGLVGVSRDISERKRAEKLLNMLNSASMAMQKALTHSQIFTTVAEELKKLNYQCMVFPVDEKKSLMFPQYMSFGQKPLKRVEHLLGTEKEKFAIRINSVSDFKKVIHRRISVFIEDIEKSMQLLLPKDLKKHARGIIRVLNIPRTILAPLLVEDKVIAVLFVQSNDLTKKDIPSITAFANQMAAAWHKATLLKNLQDNVHELRSTQEQLIHAQKMEAVGKLAGGIAHDFNNLLTIIQGYSELLLTRFPSNDRSYKDILQIEKASRSAESLVRQLLAFSRKQIMQPKVLNLKNLLHNMEPMLERLVGEDIEFSIISSPDLGQIKADPHQIEQVVMNLVVNSREALKKGGTIVVQTKNEYLAGKPHAEAGKYVLLSVSDTGCGIDDDIRGRIFEPFFTTKTKGKGTGLGLSTVYGIIQQSGGIIEVESNKNLGSTFKIYLPRVSRQKAGKKFLLSSAFNDSDGSETVLVVEDEKDVRNIISETLRLKGYRVLEAENGEVALSLCNQYNEKIELLLTDVVMPKMSGAELVKKLPPRKDGWKVLYMSGYTDNAIVHHGVLQDDISFIQKPFVPVVLAQKIREILDKS